MRTFENNGFPLADVRALCFSCDARSVRGKAPPAALAMSHGFQSVLTGREAHENPAQLRAFLNVGLGMTPNAERLGSILQDLGYILTKVSSEQSDALMYSLTRVSNRILLSKFCCYMSVASFLSTQC